MRIIGASIKEKFYRKHAQGRSSIDNFLAIVQEANWENLAQVQATWPSADLVRCCTIFNIGGNKFRLIALIDYTEQAFLIKYILPHAEYDKKNWKKICCPKREKSGSS
jgi:mRNA interferase HigB